MATPERGSVQWNLPSAVLGCTRLLSSLARLRFTPLYAHTNTYTQKQIGKRGPGRTATSTSQCDRFSRWRGVLRRKQSLCEREVKGPVRVLGVLQRCKHSTFPTRTLMIPVCNHTHTKTPHLHGLKHQMPHCIDRCQAAILER